MLKLNIIGNFVSYLLVNDDLFDDKRILLFMARSTSQVGVKRCRTPGWLLYNPPRSGLFVLIKKPVRVSGHDKVALKTIRRFITMGCYISRMYTFGTSIVTGGAAVNMGYLGATTVNSAGSGIASVINGKSAMTPSVVGSTIIYGSGKTEKSLENYFNPAKNNMRWMQSSNTPIIYPYPKSNAPAIIAGSGSAILSEMASHETEEFRRSNKVLG